MIFTRTWTAGDIDRGCANMAGQCETESETALSLQISFVIGDQSPRSIECFFVCTSYGAK